MTQGKWQRNRGFRLGALSQVRQRVGYTLLAQVTSGALMRVGFEWWPTPPKRSHLGLRLETPRHGVRLMVRIHFGYCYPAHGRQSHSAWSHGTVPVGVSSMPSGKPEYSSSRVER